MKNPLTQEMQDACNQARSEVSKMSQSESWDESDAQDLIMCGAKIYLEIKNNT